MVESERYRRPADPACQYQSKNHLVVIRLDVTHLLTVSRLDSISAWKVLHAFHTDCLCRR